MDHVFGYSSALSAFSRGINWAGGVLSVHGMLLSGSRDLAYTFKDTIGRVKLSREAELTVTEG